MEERQRTQRLIVHIDFDAFYASIEQRDHPELRGKPVVVGGLPQGRGVVATCSYEARAFGIRSALPARTAYRLCPQAIFLPPRFDVYRAVSSQVMAIFRSGTSLVEPLSLDEASLDVTEVASPLEEAVRLAQDIKRQIWGHTQCTASAGVSYCTFLAKSASDAHKPDGLTVIPQEEASAFLETLPIEQFFGRGKVTAAKLRALGIQMGADLKHMGEERLRALFGKHGGQLYRYALGRDDRPIEPVRERKSIGKEITLERDLADRGQMEAIVSGLAEQVERRLSYLEVVAGTLSLKGRWSDFHLITRSVSRTQGFRSAREMLPVLRTQLSQVGSEQRPVRLLGCWCPICGRHVMSSSTPSPLFRSGMHRNDGG